MDRLRRADVQEGPEELRARVAELEREQEELRLHVANLEAERRELRTDHRQLRRHAESIEDELSHWRGHAKNLERILKKIRGREVYKALCAVKDLFVPPATRKRRTALRARVERADANGVRPAHGALEELVVVGDTVHFGGWMLLPDTAIDRYMGRLGGKAPVELEAVARPDLHTAFPSLELSERPGFRGVVPLPAEGFTDWCALEVLGHADGRPAARMAFDVHPLVDEFVPAPPVTLMARVAQIHATRLFRLDGLRSMHELLEAAQRHRALDEIATVLDWGSGCARITAPLRRRREDWEIRGCDVDAEAVEWCQRHVDGADFSVIPERPPTGYEDASFDLILGYSIFTHLPRDMQREWLVECRRLLRPGGLLVATVHGERATALAGSADIERELARHGLSDHTVDAALAGIVTSGTYRSVFQTEEWTTKNWGEILTVLDYLPAGAGGFQDVVVLRR